MTSARANRNGVVKRGSSPLWPGAKLHASIVFTLRVSRYNGLTWPDIPGKICTQRS